MLQIDFKQVLKFDNSEKECTSSFCASMVERASRPGGAISLQLSISLCVVVVAVMSLCLVTSDMVSLQTLMLSLSMMVREANVGRSSFVSATSVSSLASSVSFDVSVASTLSALLVSASVSN